MVFSFLRILRSFSFSFSSSFSFPCRSNAVVSESHPIIVEKKENNNDENHSLTSSLPPPSPYLSLEQMCPYDVRFDELERIIFVRDLHMALNQIQNNIRYTYCTNAVRASALRSMVPSFYLGKNHRHDVSILGYVLLDHHLRFVARSWEPMDIEKRKEENKKKNMKCLYLSWGGQDKQEQEQEQEKEQDRSQAGSKYSCNIVPYRILEDFMREIEKSVVVPRAKNE